MSKLITKARAGVTLVELLVVILIVTILSVSLLPMFKDYIVKSQYAAEAIPVIGNLRTKIGLYQYEHSELPPNSTSDDNVSSWEFDSNDYEKYRTAEYAFGSAPTISEDDGKLTSTGKTPVGKYVDSDGQTQGTAQDTGHVHFGAQSMLDIDFQDLKGKRSRPIDYFYFKIPCDKQTDSAYVVGCFGAGYGGFAAGTGYAVCEINLVSEGKKYIGTFERYKAKDKAAANTCPYLYLDDQNTDVNGDTVYCPKEITQTERQAGTDGVPSVITTMEGAGWQFTK